MYLYDFAGRTFFYTSPTLPLPSLYDYPDPTSPGRYNSNGVRYFYRFDTGETITK